MILLFSGSGIIAGSSIKLPKITEQALRFPLFWANSLACRFQYAGVVFVAADCADFGFLMQVVPLHVGDLLYKTFMHIHYISQVG